MLTIGYAFLLAHPVTLTTSISARSEGDNRKRPYPTRASIEQGMCCPLALRSQMGYLSLIPTILGELMGVRECKIGLGAWK